MIASKNQLHYEVFTNVSESELNKFLDNEAGLFQDRKFIKLTKGSKIKTTPPEVVISAGEHTLRHDYAIATDTALIVEGNNKQAYYRMILPDGNQSVVGYHPKRDMSSPDIICQHDWRKMGFEIVEESNSNADGLMDLEEMPKFFKDLHKEIDQFGAKGRAGYGDGVITAVELKLALQNHRLRDRWSKLIAYHPSEWRKDNTSIVEAMKGLLTGVKRTLNTLRVKGELKKNVELGKKVLEHEKERMKELAFWEEVSELGSPSVYHFHPIAFVGNLMTGGATCKVCGKSLILEYSFLKSIAPNATDAFLNDFATLSRTLFPKYEINTCSQVIHFLGQTLHESTGFTAFREGLYYSRVSYTADSLYRMATTAIDNGFRYWGIDTPTRDDKITYIENNLLANDARYGRHCFGKREYPNNDYRGRGLIHLTFHEQYAQCARDTGLDIVNSPSLLETDSNAIIESSLWFWDTRNIRARANEEGLTLDAAVSNVTVIINTGRKHLLQRQARTRAIIQRYTSRYDDCSSIQRI